MRLKPLYTLALLCSLLLAQACAPRFTPPHDPPLAEPELSDTTFVSFDGTQLPLRAWLPARGMTAAEYILVAVHGFNDYSYFMHSPAPYFTTRRVAVYAYDQRGFGQAPVRGLWSSSDTMARDLTTLVSLLAGTFPDKPIYVLGHSMGGALIIHALAGEENPAVRGAILVAPAVWARATMPFYQNVSLWLAAHTAPWSTVTGAILKRTACSNSEVLRAQGRDPLVIKETRIDTIFGLQNLMDSAYERAERFTLKTLLLYGRHDEIIPAEPVHEVFRRFPDGTEKNHKQLILYEEGYHMLLRDLQAERVLQDIFLWMHE